VSPLTHPWNDWGFSGIPLALMSVMVRAKTGNQWIQLGKSMSLWMSAAGALFASSVILLVHDSLALNQPLSESEIRDIVTSRPQLLDKFGHAIRVSDENYQTELLSGKYYVRPGSKLPMLSPKNQVALVDVSQVSLASLKNWRIESFTHEIERAIGQKQQDSMWLSQDPELYIQNILFLLCTILLLGTLYVSIENGSRGEKAPIS
jgi:hypothetical protein